MKSDFDAVLFDLLSALIDSWSLWDDLAGDTHLGRKWRMHYLNAASHAGIYSPYLSLVANSAKAVGISRLQAIGLGTRWNELTPWPEAPALIAKLAFKTKIGVVTNCSEELGTNVQIVWEHNSMLLLLQSVPDITNRTRRSIRKLLLKSARCPSESYMSQDLHWM